MKKGYKIWIGITSVMLLGAGIFYGTKPFIEEAGLPVMKGIEDGFEITDFKNGKYKSRLELPDMPDINLKLGGDGKSKSIDWGCYEPDERVNSQVGSLYITEKKNRLIDGALVTKLMYITVTKE